MTLTVTRHDPQNSLDVRTYDICGSTSTLSLKKGQSWTVAVNNPGSIYKLGYRQPYSSWSKVPTIYYDLTLNSWTQSFWGEYACNENRSLDTEGDPLSFHFIAATSGTQDVTFHVYNDVGPSRSYSGSDPCEALRNALANADNAVGPYQNVASFSIKVTVQ